MKDGKQERRDMDVSKVGGGELGKGDEGQRRVELRTVTKRKGG